MSVNALFILDLKGKRILTKKYRLGVSTKWIRKTFLKRVINVENSEPCFTDDGLSFVFIKHNNLYLLVTTKYDTNAVMLLTFLYHLVAVFEKYFGKVEEESIKDNFVVVYDILDEVMDMGYPQTTDFQVLQEFIKEETFKLSDLNLETLNIDSLKSIVEKNIKTLKKNFVSNSEDTSNKLAIPKRLTGISTRKAGIHYEKNEVFLDVVEYVHMVVSKKGLVINSTLEGVLKMKCYLSGFPTVKLGLNDKVLFENLGRDISKRTTVDLDDIKFHQCVRLNKFQKDRTILFSPPDGEFDLMKYRLNTRMNPLFLVTKKTKVHGNSRIEYFVQFKTNFTARCTASNVDVFIPVPEDTEAPKFDPDFGKVEYIPDRSCIVWNIKNIKGKTILRMKGELSLPSITSSQNEEFQKKPIKVQFKIPYYSVSKLQVRYLKVMDKSGYTALPLCRYMVQHGDYQIRT